MRRSFASCLLVVAVVGMIGCEANIEVPGQASDEASRRSEVDPTVEVEPTVSPTSPVPTSPSPSLATLELALAESTFSIVAGTNWSLAPSATATLTACVATPALPPGLLMSSACAISGAPTTPVPTTTYQLKATASSGVTATISVTLKVLPKIQVSTLPLDFIAKVTVDSAARAVSMTDLPTSRLISFELIEVNATDDTLTCDSLPNWIRQTGRAFALDVVTLAADGGTTLSCATAYGPLSIALSYKKSSYRSIVSSKYFRTGYSTEPLLSPDGRWLFFKTIPAADSRGYTQIMAKNLTSGQLYLMTSPDGVTPADATHSLVSVSPDSKWLVFGSMAPSLGVPAGTCQYFLKDLTRPLEPPQMVSVLADGVTPSDATVCTGVAFLPTSDEIVFGANALNLGADNVANMQVFRKSLANLQTPATVLSVAADGTLANNSCNQVQVSPDGAYVYFMTAASTLGVSGTSYQLVRKSLTSLTAAPEIVSVVGGVQASSGIIDYEISPQGDLVAISTSSANFGVSNGNWQVVLKSTSNLAAAPKVLSVAADGTTLGASYSFLGVFSPDGSAYYFLTSSVNLGATGLQVLRKSTTDLTTAPVVVSTDGGDQLPSDIVRSSLAVSPDGRSLYFVYENQSGQEIGYAVEAGYSLIRKRLDDPAVALADVGLSGPGIALMNEDTSYSAGGDFSPRVSHDGTFVLFLGQDGNYLNPPNNKWQIYLKSLVDPDLPITMISVAGDGVTPGSDNSYDPQVTPDGKHVVFQTTAANLGGSAASHQIVRKSLEDLAQAPDVVSVAADGTTVGTASSGEPQVSPDGAFVYFQTTSSNLGVSNALRQIIRKSLTNLATTPQVVSVASGGSTQGNGNSGLGTISDDGSFMLFHTFAPNFGASSSVNQVVKKSLTNLATAPQVVSVGGDGTTKGDGYGPVLSADGSTAIFFTSSAVMNPNLCFSAQLVKKSLSSLATPVEVVSARPDGTCDEDVESWPLISADGSTVYFIAKDIEVLDQTFPHQGDVLVSRSMAALSDPATPLLPSYGGYESSSRMTWRRDRRQIVVRYGGTGAAPSTDATANILLIDVP